MSNGKQIDMTPNLRILAIQFLTPFVQTASYGGTHRPVDRVVLRQRKIQDGKPSNDWEQPAEFKGWSARIEGGSVFVRPAHRVTGDILPEEIEIPRSHVAITWDRSEEVKADAKPEEKKSDKAQDTK